jgi:predicted DNA-binding transcriptional regulator AlpA
VRRSLQATELATSARQSDHTRIDDASPDSGNAATPARLIVSTIPHRLRVSGDTRFLTIGQVRERFNVSDMWVWRYMRNHGFPRPVKFGGPTSARHWLLADIEQWERERIKLAGAKS